MAESMKGLHRTHRCTEVSNQNIGETVTVMGWVQKRRNLGSLIFIDLRDRSGLLQVVFDEPQVGSEGFEKAGNLRSEFVVAVTGVVQKRSAAVNESLKTGDIEVIANDIRILSEAETPPFPIEENCQTKEELRLKYRYLDLRRPDLQRNIMMKSKVSMLLRNFMEKEGFLEIEGEINASIDTKCTVIATGGSVVYEENAMQHLKEISTVVYIYLPYEELRTRLGSLEQRGVALKPEETLKDLYDSRSVLYKKYADITVDASHMGIQAVAEEILRKTREAAF